MRKLVVLAVGAALAVSTGCGDKNAVEPTPIARFDSLSQANPTFALQLVGGSGQWTVKYSVSIYNTTTVPRILELTTGGCPLQLDVYNNPQGTGTPAWRELVAAFGCKIPLTEVDTILPGDSVVIVGRGTSTTEILAHYDVPPANPPGTYYFFTSLFTPLAPGGVTRQLVGLADLR
jgi:hypothetical protein